MALTLDDIMNTAFNSSGAMPDIGGVSAIKAENPGISDVGAIIKSAISETASFTTEAPPADPKAAPAIPNLKGNSAAMEVSTALTNAARTTSNPLVSSALKGSAQVTANTGNIIDSIDKVSLDISAATKQIDNLMETIKQGRVDQANRVQEVTKNYNSANHAEALKMFKTEKASLVEAAKAVQTASAPVQFLAGLVGYDPAKRLSAISMMEQTYVQSQALAYQLAKDFEEAAKSAPEIQALADLAVIKEKLPLMKDEVAIKSNLLSLSNNQLDLFGKVISFANEKERMAWEKQLKALQLQSAAVELEGAKTRNALSDLELKSALRTFSTIGLVRGDASPEAVTKVANAFTFLTSGRAENITPDTIEALGSIPASAIRTYVETDPSFKGASQAVKDAKILEMSQRHTAYVPAAKYVDKYRRLSDTTKAAKPFSQYLGEQVSQGVLPISLGALSAVEPKLLANASDLSPSQQEAVNLLKSNFPSGKIERYQDAIKGLVDNLYVKSVMDGAPKDRAAKTISNLDKSLQVLIPILQKQQNQNFVNLKDKSKGFGIMVEGRDGLFGSKWYNLANPQERATWIRDTVYSMQGDIGQ